MNLEVRGWQHNCAEPTVPRLQREAVRQEKKAIGNSLGPVEHEADFVLTGYLSLMSLSQSGWV